MTRKISVVCLIFGIANIPVAFVPPVVNAFGVFYVVSEPPFPYKHVDIGQPVWQQIKKDMPAYKPEVIGSSVCNGFLSLVLVVGSIGLFLNHDWGRIVCIGTALLMTLTCCFHDVYQLLVVRPAVMATVARVVPAANADEAQGAQLGFSFFWFFWCWVNPLLIIYSAGDGDDTGADAHLRRQSGRRRQGG